MTNEIMEAVKKARRDAEAEIGFEVSDELAEEVLEHCKRKCVCAKKDDDYLPIMYRFELPMYLSMMAINAVSKAMQEIRKEGVIDVRCLPANAMSPTMP